MSQECLLQIFIPLGALKAHGELLRKYTAKGHNLTFSPCVAI
ncbi:MAG: hypothetical protein V9G20_08450 [Candidatus Promineifilaceae bacterium]